MGPDDPVKHVVVLGHTGCGGGKSVRPCYIQFTMLLGGKGSVAVLTISQTVEAAMKPDGGNSESDCDDPINVSFDSPAVPGL